MESGSKSMETGSKGGRLSDMSFEEIQNLFKDVNFPANKPEIVNGLRKNGASSEVMRDIDTLPDTEYNSAAEVVKRLKKEV